MASANSPKASFCVICYRIDSSVTLVEANEKFKLFIKVLHRFVNNNVEISNFKAITDLECFYLGCCKECLNQAEEFCNVYHEYKCLQLQLEWKIDKIVNIIKLANKVPSRVLQVKKILQDSNEVDKGDQDLKDENGNLEVVQRFRHHLTKICRNKVKRSQPRVTLSNDVKILHGKDQQNISTSSESTLCLENEVIPVKLLPETTILSEPENEGHTNDSVQEVIPIEAQDEDALPTNDIGMVTPSDIQADNVCFDNIDIALDDDPANFSGEEMFDDFNTFPISNDPLDDVSTHDNDSIEPSTCLKITESTNVHKHNNKQQYFQSTSDSANISNLQSDMNGISSSFNTDNVASFTLSSFPHAQPVETKHSTVISLNEASTSQPTIEPSNPNQQNNCHLNDIQEVKHPKTIHNPPSNINPPQDRYNLRQNRVTKYVTQSENDDSESEKEFTHQTCSSRSSSVSSSSHDEEVQEEKAIPNFNFERIPHPKTFHYGFYPCLVVGCEEMFANEQKYQTHVKLHKPGQYKCKFCKKVKTDVIKLGYHESKYHSKTNSYQDRRSNPWTCPRCSYQSTCNLDYDTHFAYAHFKIGDNPKFLQFQVRKYRNPKPINMNIQIVECETCKKKLRAHKMELHFKKHHDLTKIDPKDVQRCDDDNCSAYFLRREQLLRHYYSEHNIEPMKCKRKLKPKDVSMQPKSQISKGKFIQCEICGTKVWTEKKQEHFNKFHGTTDSNDIKKCTKENCPAYFLTDEQLKRHVLFKHDKLYSCRNCKQIFPSHILLYRHYREKHKNRVKPKTTLNTAEGETFKFQCAFCDLIRKSPKALALHEAGKHAIPLEQDTRTRKQFQRHRCPRFPFEYIYKMTHLGHFFNDHLNISCVNCPDACKMCSSDKIYVENTENHFNNCHNTDLLVDPSKVFKCDFKGCSAYFLKSLALHCHKNKLHPFLNCLKCEKTFETRRKLVNHLRKCQKPFVEKSHPNLSISCDNPTCTVKFHNKEEMEAHMIYAHPKNPKVPKEKNEICPKCGRGFNSIGRLKYHMRVGHAESTFICSECGRVLKSQFHLDQHMIFHKGPDAWEYQCTECGKKCFDKQKLNEHSRIHTKEKPFVCQFCGGKYAHRHNWRNHLKTKHGDEKGIDEIVGKGRKRNYLSRKGSKKGECIIGNSVIA